MGSAGSRAFSITARATGKSMSVVAVLEIHIESMAEAAMNPNTRRRLLVPPNARTMVRATRKCAPLFSIAVDRMNPPSNSNTR